MLLFPSMLAPHAKSAGMPVPSDDQITAMEKGDDEPVKQGFPHFFVFCNIQLGRRLTSWAEPADNAVVIAAIPADKIKTVTIDDLRELGVNGI